MQEDGQAAHPPLTLSSSLRRRLAVDYLAARLFVLGGWAMVVAVAAIIVVIAAEALPAFRAPGLVLTSHRIIPAVGVPLASGVDEYSQRGYRIDSAGTLAFFSLRDDSPPAVHSVSSLGAATLTAIDSTVTQFYLGTSDGRVIPLTLAFQSVFTSNSAAQQLASPHSAAGVRAVTEEISFGEPIQMFEGDPVSISKLVSSRSETEQVVVAVGADNRLAIAILSETKPLIGPPEKSVKQQLLTLPIAGQITSTALTSEGSALFVGSDRGEIYSLELTNWGQLSGSLRTVVSGLPPIQSLALLIGDRTLVAGYRSGELQSFHLLRDSADRKIELNKVYDFESHEQAISLLAKSSRNRTFISSDSSGVARLHYSTSGETLAQFDLGLSPLAGVSFSPKADGVIAVDTKGGISFFALDNPHPEVSLFSLFGKVYYEDYREPTWVWQSSSGSDAFEPKMSLTPLIFGTLKATLYALLFAVPLAILSALYVSQFMHPRLQAWIKPIIELMSAMPSVVIGFLAGLWLAPKVDLYAPGIFLAPLVLIIWILLGLFVYERLPQNSRFRVRAGYELSLLLPLVLSGLALALLSGVWFEASLLGGSYKMWLRENFQITVDQRNSIVVGIAMGFAIIPIIFTIAEDALTAVPKNLSAASLALGASKWQTALKVVLPAASAGIFSAVMIGFGRAVGETMIVLMATGNTPVMDWSIFNGLRALSANIAVELPEAPHQGTHYRVLFLAALLLFALTFCVNTVSEIIRMRLRKKYKRL